MGADAEVVDEQTGRLARGGAVDAGDGLQQLGVLDEAVEVERLLDRRVEAGQQHGAHQQEGDRAGVLAGRPERLLEVGDRPRPGAPCRSTAAQVGSSLWLPEMTGTKSSRRDEVALRQGAQQHLLAAVQPVDVEAAVGGAGDQRRRQSVELGDEIVAGSQQGLAVADGRQPAGGGQLGLEAAGQHRRHVVPEHRLGLGGDELRRFEDGAGRGVARLELLQLLGGVLDEHVLEQLVEVAAAGHRSLGGAALVEDRHDRLVGLGLADRVLVDERSRRWRRCASCPRA